MAVLEAVVLAVAVLEAVVLAVAVLEEAAVRALRRRSLRTQRMNTESSTPAEAVAHFGTC